jgi:hypothetical protein
MHTNVEPENLKLRNISAKKVVDGTIVLIWILKK